MGTAESTPLDDESVEPLAWLGVLWTRRPRRGACMTASRAGWRQIRRRLVLLIDEIDAPIGDTLLSVLRQLCAGYERCEELW